MKTFATLALLSVCAMWSVVSASADTVRYNGKNHNLSEKAEANDLSIVIGAPAPSQHSASGGIVFTEDGGKFISDVIQYDANIGSYVFRSDTGTSLTGNFGGFKKVAETGKFQDVSGYFGLGKGTLEVRSTLDSTATPLPPAWTIMLTGLVGLGFMLHRRRQPGGVEGLAGMTVA